MEHSCSSHSLLVEYLQFPSYALCQFLPWMLLRLPLCILRAAAAAAAAFFLADRALGLHDWEELLLFQEDANCR